MIQRYQEKAAGHEEGSVGYNHIAEPVLSRALLLLGIAPLISTHTRDRVASDPSLPKPITPMITQTPSQPLQSISPSAPSTPIAVATSPRFFSDARQINISRKRPEPKEAAPAGGTGQQSQELRQLQSMMRSLRAWRHIQRHNSEAIGPLVLKFVEVSFERHEL